MRDKAMEKEDADGWREEFARNGAVGGGGNRLSEFFPVQSKLAEASAMADAARLMINRDTAEVERITLQGHPLSVDQRIRNRRDVRAVGREIRRDPHFLGGAQHRSERRPPGDAALDEIGGLEREIRRRPAFRQPRAYSPPFKILRTRLVAGARQWGTGDRCHRRRRGVLDYQ